VQEACISQVNTPLLQRLDALHASIPYKYKSQLLPETPGNQSAFLGAPAAASDPEGNVSSSSCVDCAPVAAFGQAVRGNEVVPLSSSDIVTSKGHAPGAMRALVGGVIAAVGVLISIAGTR
jgi:hypothetical protein